MNPGEDFEIRCFEYLKKAYSNPKLKFKHSGGMDSTTSDIALYKDDKLEFYIEAKSPSAQSGQFVLIPDDNTKSFIYSDKNKSKQNEISKIIINHMNKNYELYKNAGTAGKSINLDQNIFADWIIDHYQKRNVKFVISYNSDFVIFPINRFASYFNIVANYRAKKSGSSDPARKDIKLIENELDKIYSKVTYQYVDKKFYATINEIIKNHYFSVDNKTYYLSKQNIADNVYRITRLSNTNNMNVIFSISIKKEQEKSDLSTFLEQL